jgi:nicotinamide-nucleotide amidase
MLAEKIEHWENALPNFIKLAYLPSALTVRLRLSAYGTDHTILETEINKQVKELLTIIPENIFGFDDENMALVIGRILVATAKTLAVAESCTGEISHILLLPTPEVQLILKVA